MADKWSIDNSTGTVNMGVWDQAEEAKPAQKKLVTPDNRIERMMAQVKRSNLFSRPYLYYVTITLPNKLQGAFSKQIKEIGLNCDTVSIPGQAIATKEHKTYGLKREYAYEKLLEPISMSFYVSDDLQEYNMLREWLGLMFDKGRMGYYTDYIGTITIYQCSNIAESGDDDLRVMLSAKLIEAYPKTISSLELGYGASGSQQKVSTEIMYRDVRYKDHTGLISENTSISSVDDHHRQISDVASITNNPRALSNITSKVQSVLDPLSLPKLTTVVKGASAGISNSIGNFLSSF